MSKRGKVNPKTGVTPKEEKFSRKFVEFTGKGMKPSKAAKKAAAIAYKPTKSSIHYRYAVLRRDRVQKYIVKLLDDAGFSDQAVMRDLRRAISRGLESDKTSLSDAIRGLDMVLKLKNMYPQQRIEKGSVKYDRDLLSKSNRDLRREQEKLDAEEAEIDELLAVEEGEIVDE